MLTPQVDQLLSMQQQLRGLLGTAAAGQKPSTAQASRSSGVRARRIPWKAVTSSPCDHDHPYSHPRCPLLLTERPLPSARVAVASSAAVEPSSNGEMSAGKAQEMRQLLGKAVQEATELQLTSESLRDELREAKTLAESGKHNVANAKDEVAALKAELMSVQKQLEDERSERMEEGAAAMEREEKLEAIIEEMKVPHTTAATRRSCVPAVVPCARADMPKPRRRYAPSHHTLAITLTLRSRARVPRVCSRCWPACRRRRGSGRTWRECSPRPSRRQIRRRPPSRSPRRRRRRRAQASM